MEHEVILITGASSGIGRQLAIRLAERGASIIAVGRSAERLSLPTRAGAVTARLCDFADVDEVARLGEDLSNHSPPLTTVIHCAAVQENVRLDDPDYGADRLIAEATIDFVAPMILMRILAPVLAVRHGAIVTLSTGLAFAPKSTAAVYSASKAGLLAFSDALRVQFPGLHVADVILPIVDTPMTAGRGGGKISALAAADAILEGMERRAEQIHVGKARMLPLLMRVAPGLVRRMMARG